VQGETLVLRANHSPFAKQGNRVCFDDAPTKDGRRALVFADVKVPGTPAFFSSHPLYNQLSRQRQPECQWRNPRNYERGRRYARVRVLPVEVTARSSDTPVEYVPRHEVAVRPYLEHLKVAGLHRVQYGVSTSPLA
jgi:hypothetical protein